MKTKTIRQTLTFEAKPAEVYELLMNAKKHAAFSGSKVTMSTKPNGVFSVFDGYCTGFNISLVEGKRIVQAWNFKEDGWPDDHYSICTFEFKKAPKGTTLSFKQEYIPEHKAVQLKDGWKLYYWQPMKAYLAGKKSKK